MATIESKSLQRMGFLLVPNFALMSYASATEPLRAANLIAGVPLYDVTLLSSSGQPMRSSSGLTIDCDDLLAKGGACHTVFVCAGGTRHDWVDRDGLYGTLRKLSRQGVRIGGISSGAFLLAAAGLMDNRDFTIHWEHAELLKEAFPHLSPRQARYVIDGDRITCGGGIAPLDMMHAMISERMGSHFARRVSDWYLHAAVGEPTAPQRGSAAERFGTHHPALLTILEKMEAAIEQPLSRHAMAKVAGISVRHLDRLFADHQEIGFLEAYRNVRLDHARRLLEQSPLSISEISYATGFSSAGQFSKAFSARFSSTPSRLRDKIRESKR
ncbi:GlxA family transcriptional regulator [Mesorhizobium sp.]|uniref:GlxA family transcriptional regulator n=1 Tax=Mesorhizobium sp. TaxID=1871066 RepID=UPI000FE49B11|nr:GlxA family transcriptional regulator [Mesorhizobium sp.]RWO18303.1 MAG: GlxA family transcriptional regulator [Mesorhizobium sp.]